MFRLAHGTLALLLIVLLLCAGAWVELSAQDASAAKVETVVKWANASIALTLAILGIGCAVAVVSDAQRIRRGMSARPGASA